VSAVKVGAFAVGDRVTVYAHNGNLVAVRTIVSVAPKGNVCTDSRNVEWCNEEGGRFADGRRERGYTGQNVRAMKPGDVDIVRRAVLLVRVGATSWHGLTLETLTAIDALIRADATVKP
jgi:hypothetical protein